MPYATPLASAVAALCLSACVVAPYGPPYAGGPYAGVPYGVEGGGPVVIADVPPPAPYGEVVPAIPFPGAIWIGGYWGWGGHRHQWVPGRWEHPRPGYGWHPYRWEQRGSQWQLHPGGWARR